MEELIATIERLGITPEAATRVLDSAIRTKRLAKQRYIENRDAICKEKREAYRAGRTSLGLPPRQKKNPMESVVIPAPIAEVSPSIVPTKLY